MKSGAGISISATHMGKTLGFSKIACRKSYFTHEVFSLLINRLKLKVMLKDLEDDLKPNSNAKRLDVWIIQMG